MVQFFDAIPERLYDFIRRSHLFFVATAPLEGGCVNVSPKAAAGAFEIVNQNRVRYLDFTGSGNETISHLLQPGNGRITVMFVNIEEGSPNILRMYGKGTVHEKLIASPESSFQEIVGAERPPPGTRAIIDIAISMVSTSCGYSIPIFEYVKGRTILSDWATKMEAAEPESEATKRMLKSKGKEFPKANLYCGDTGRNRPAQSMMEAYWGLVNSLSIDGLPGLKMGQMILSEEEREDLLQKKKTRDALEPPKESAGPFRAKAETKQTFKAGQDGGWISTHAASYQLFLAFVFGCSLTASLMLARQGALSL